LENTNNFSIPYTVSPISNIAAYSIKSFSTTDSNMRSSDGQLYSDAKIYFDYYGQTDYTDALMIAVFENKATSFDNGNLDFFGRLTAPFAGKYIVFKKCFRIILMLIRKLKSILCVFF
jgi:hypothetical protein